MSIIYLTSTSGAPGVSTLATALAVNWVRPSLLLEADTTKTSSVLAGFLGGRYSHQQIGLTELAVANGRNQLNADTIFSQTISSTQGHGHYIVPGFNDLRGAIGATPSFWANLTRALYDFPRVAGAAELDIFIDGGRYRAGDGREHLMAAADSVILVTGDTIPDIAAAHTALPYMAQALEMTAHVAYLSLVISASPHKSPYGAAEIHKLTERPVLESFPWEPSTAAAYSHGSAQPGRKSPYMARLAEMITGLDVILADRRYVPQNGAHA